MLFIKLAVVVFLFVAIASSPRPSRFAFEISEPSSPPGLLTKDGRGRLQITFPSPIPSRPLIHPSSDGPCHRLNGLLCLFSEKRIDILVGAALFLTRTHFGPCVLIGGGRVYCLWGSLQASIVPTPPPREGCAPDSPPTAPEGPAATTAGWRGRIRSRRRRGIHPKEKKKGTQTCEWKK